MEEDKCNAYSYSSGGSDCLLARLEWLEDPEPGQAEQPGVMVEAGAGLHMACRGGEHCCQVGHQGTRSRQPRNILVQGDNQCGEGEGDCNTDQDCAGLLVCGRDNCGRAGGRRAALYRSAVPALCRWDAGDDCCERACTAAHPCGEGAGHCESGTGTQHLKQFSNLF